MYCIPMLDAHHYHYFQDTLIKENSITNSHTRFFYLRISVVIGSDSVTSPCALVAN